MYMMISPGPEPDEPSGSSRALTSAIPQSSVRAFAKRRFYPVTLLTTLVTLVLAMNWRFDSALPFVYVLALGFNLYWLWVFGRQAETQLGKLATFTLMLLFGSVPWAVDFALTDSSTSLSGIAFGLFALFAVLGHRHPSDFKIVDWGTTVVFIGWFFVCCALSAMGLTYLDIVAQISGAVLGCLTGMVLDSDPHFCHNLAQAHWRRGEYAEAVVGAERSFRLRPRNARYQLFLAALGHQLAPDDVRAEFWHELNHGVLNPRDPNDAMERTIGTTLKEAMRYHIDRVVPICREMFLQPRRLGGWLGPNEACVRYALQLASEAHQRDPFDATIHCAMSFLHGLLGEHEKSVTTARKALWLQPDQKYGSQALAAALARRAAYFQKAGRTDEAVSVFRDALATETSDAYAWHWLCIALTNLGIPNDSMKVAQQGLKRYRPQKSLSEILACQQAEKYRSPVMANELRKKIRKMVADYCKQAARKKHFRIRTALPMSRDTLLLLHAILAFKPYDAIIWCGISVVAGLMGDKQASLTAAQKAVALRRIDPCCQQMLETAKTRMG